MYTSEVLAPFLAVHSITDFVIIKVLAYTRVTQASSKSDFIAGQNGLLQLIL